MKKTLNRLLVLVLFAALLVVLLAYQGILFRHEPEAVEALPGQAVPAGAERVAAVEREVAAAWEQPAFVEAEDPVALAPRAMGVVLEVAVREGEEVAAGRVVVRLDDADASARLEQARAAADGARAMRARAEAAWTRAERLHGAGAMTDADWEAARAAVEAARAAVARAEAAVAEAEEALSWYRLAAPVAGRVLAREVAPGDLALPGRPALVLYDPERLRLTAAVPAAWLEPGEPEPGGPPRGLGVGDELRWRGADGAERTATVTRVVPGADPTTGTVTLHLAPSSPDGLRPGELGRIVVPGAARRVVAVPKRAVERVGQVERVRRVFGERWEPVVVRTGRDLGDGWVEVLAGLAPGEEVVLP